MKIAVTTTGETLEAPVDARFGRAARFIVVDTETNAFEVVDNAQNLNAMQGAGIQAAQTVAQLGAECVLTGHCGPKAFRALTAAGVATYAGAQGSVAEALERFERGELTRAEGADVEGHWS